jgi:hypothetical protein
MMAWNCIDQSEKKGFTPRTAWRQKLADEWGFAAARQLICWMCLPLLVSCAALPLADNPAPTPLWSNAIWFQASSKEFSREELAAKKPNALDRERSLRAALAQQCTGNAANAVCRARYDRFLGQEGDTREPLRRCEAWTHFWREEGYSEVGWRRAFCVLEAELWLEDLKHSRIAPLNAQGKTCAWACEQ